MIKLTIVLEDCTLTATAGETGWVGTSHDAFTGMSVDFTLNGEQMGAIAALAICGDEWDSHDGSSVVAALYRIAEPAVSDWPDGNRPMP